MTYPSSVSSDNSSTYSNSLLRLVFDDDNGDLQHKVVVKNVKKNAAEKLQNWAKSCLQRKIHQYVQLFERKNIFANVLHIRNF